MQKRNNVVFWKGPSVLTGDPIVGLLCGIKTPSHNEKTGPMVQAMILRDDIPPTEAVKFGGDAAICGDCPLRSGSNIGRACYVIWWLSPQNAWKAYKRGAYDWCSANVVAPSLKGKAVRVAAYGDPAAIPFEEWEALLEYVSDWTGYTHLWRSCDSRFKRLLMASVETTKQGEQARALGWRTFRSGREPVNGKLEVSCPASREMGHRTTCDRCQLCQGASLAAKSVVIQPHGQRTKWM